MSTGREKDQKDYNLEQIVRIIDSALESDDQRIKDALRALMTITVLCTAEHPDQAFKGPLGRLMEDVRDLNRRIYDIEDKLHQLKWDQQKRQVEPFIPPYQSPTGPLGPNPTTGWPGIINDPTKVKPMWDSIDAGLLENGLPDVKKWAAGDDPNYKGASSGMLAEDFIKELEKR